MSPTNSPSVLIACHPGHEVRLHGWLGRARPRVFILTDGSGLYGQPRIKATAGYLAEMGLEQGSIFGRLTDRAMYQALLDYDFQTFIKLSDELAGAIAGESVECVAGDAAEGFNTSHDVCRLLINTAVEMANRSSHRPIRSFDFPIINRPDACPPHLHQAAIWLNLDQQTFEHKISAAKRFYPEIFAEVEEALSGKGERPMKAFLERQKTAQDETAKSGLEMFRIECLRPAGGMSQEQDFTRETPFYEVQSEKLQREGHFSRVIRYEEHIRPLADALTAHLERSV